MPMVPTTATRAEVKRRMTWAAASPATSAPAGNAATTTPYSALVSPSSVLISGSRGTRLAKIAPLVRKSAATATRARRFRSGLLVRFACPWRLAASGDMLGDDLAGADLVVRRDTRSDRSPATSTRVAHAR